MPAKTTPHAETHGDFEATKSGRLRGVETEESGIAILAAHSLNGVLVYERDVKEYAKNKDNGLHAVHVRGSVALRLLSHYFAAVADHQDGKTAASRAPCTPRSSDDETSQKCATLVIGLGIAVHNKARPLVLIRAEDSPRGFDVRDAWKNEDLQDDSCWDQGALRALPAGLYRVHVHFWSRTLSSSDGVEHDSGVRVMEAHQLAE